MTRRLPGPVTTAFLLVLLAVSPAAAQTAPVADVAISWNMVIHTDARIPAGWAAAFTGHVTDLLSIVGEVSGNYLGETQTTWDMRTNTFVGGVRFRFGGSSKVRPFIQVLAGATRHVVHTWPATTDFCFQPGGGIDIEIKPNLAFRVQGDGRLITADSGSSIRVAAGLAFGFGGN